jgi:hypothetical protein
MTSRAAAKRNGCGNHVLGVLSLPEPAVRHRRHRITPGKSLSFSSGVGRQIGVFRYRRFELILRRERSTVTAGTRPQGSSVRRPVTSTRRHGSSAPHLGRTIAV